MLYYYNFADASKKAKEYDLQGIFNNTIVKEVPILVVTLVGNHDMPALQALESVVEDWFKHLAYALILLREDGYPCIFATDYYGTKYKDLGKDGQEY